MNCFVSLELTLIAVVNSFVSLIISGIILNRTGIDYTPIYD